MTFLKNQRIIAIAASVAIGAAGLAVGPGFYPAAAVWTLGLFCYGAYRIWHGAFLEFGYFCIVALVPALLAQQIFLAPAIGVVELWTVVMIVKFVTGLLRRAFMWRARTKAESRRYVSGEPSTEPRSGTSDILAGLGLNVE